MLIKGSENHIDYELYRLQEEYDISDNAQKSEFVNKAAKVIAGIQNPIERDIYLTSFSNKYSVSKDAMLSQIKRIAGERRKKEEKKVIRDTSLQTSASKLLKTGEVIDTGVVATEEEIISILLDPDLVNERLACLNGDDFINPLFRDVYNLISKRASAGQKTDVSMLDQFFDDDVVSYLTGICTKRNSKAVEKDYFIELCQRLEFEKITNEIKRSSGDKMADELLRLVQQKKKITGDKK